jgi:hypothetical protein
MATAHPSIADLDKRAMDLQHLVQLKKTQLAAEHSNLLKNVKENPYLQVALNEYKTQLKTTTETNQKQINALEALLQGIEPSNVADRTAIKREIKRIKENY